ncbi:BCCT family transporter [Haloarcula onubensis]|uniref:BCCT family transporter n=1 Tax=Haloarcula onubensis TaxID=2950539 RepID=A0ABU2FM97_9EURY|nr:BCCT family transporter [Halomicroarcula sp. S3CR25-11]MDS0281883.1 BCCT family transporter [Halomicroarcula sp. S3CR25-11]
MSTGDDDVLGETSEGLQVELFHPDTDRETGDANVQAFGIDVHSRVFPLSCLFIALFIAGTLAFRSQAAGMFSAIQTGISAVAGWFYILSVNVFIVVVLYFALGKFGSIRIGGVEAEKDFSDFSWVAMLFSAGMGIGLMFFSVAEPIFHFGAVPPFYHDVQSGGAAARGAAMATTFFHWGIHPWAIYALVGLGLAFFSFNRGLPLTFRSIFWPLLGERIYGWPGHVIDILSVIATLFGLSTSLGIGVQQINAGLTALSGQFLPTTIPQAVWIQVVLIGIITAIATLSVAAGLDGGVRRLSEFNVYLMVTLLGAMLVVGPTLYVLANFVTSLGTYINVLPELAFWSQTGGGTTWQSGWTIFYWGWWISWSPFVGMFIARISKGRTVREFVLGVLIVPTLFSFFWMSTFGGSALFVELETGGSLVAAVNADVATAIYEMFSYFPLAVPLSALTVVLVVTFFVTSSDSGSLVIDHLTSGGKHDVPAAQRIFWAVIEGVIAAVLLIGGGLEALQTASITAGLPFTFVLLLMCYTVYVGLGNERRIMASEEFAEWMERLEERGSVQVQDDGVVVTDDGDPAPGDD